MSIILKKQKLKVKDENGVYTTGVDALADTSLEEAINIINSRAEEILESIPTDYTQLSNIVNTHEEKITDVMGDVVNNKEDIDNINTSISNINTNLSNTNTNVNNINTHINNIGTSIDNINTSINNINTSITEIESEVEDISNNTVKLISTTYENLVNLRNTSKLIPGMQYRITDYICTTTQEESRAVSHPFDIIVTADTASTLNENARACLHEGDTYYSAEDCKANLSAWELKYSLDNDTTRYAWADEENGRGVIYWLKDDWGNECPYDFKQIQFKRYVITECTKSSGLVGSWTSKSHSSDIEIDEDDYIWCYTFNWIPDEGDYEDLSVYQLKYYDDEGINNHCYENVVAPYYITIYDYEITCVSLNNIVFISTEEYDDGMYYGCYNNTFGSNCSSNTFGNSCYNNTFGSNCSSNTFGSYCYSSTFDYDIYSNTFGNYCYNNTFDNFFRYNTFGSNCSYNTFGIGFYNNTFGNYCHYNTFGSNCSSNTFGNYCYNNTFENNIERVTLSNTSATSSNRIQNYHVLQGTGTNSSKITVSTSLNRSYCTYVGENSSGVVKTWNPADLAT